MTSEFGIAVHALVYLSHKKQTLSSEALAENICTNPARIRKVMAKMKRAELILTKEGIEGGYFFSRKAEKTTLKEVAKALEVKFVYANWKSGDEEKSCLVASGMAGIMDEIYDRLHQLCLEELEQITIADIENRIFQGGKAV